MKMVISAIVEVYKVLQSCQVSLYCETDLLLAKFKLSLTCNAITLLNVDKCLCKITFSEIKLKPTSISGLMIDGNIITFRVQIESSEISLTQSENKGVKYIPDVSKDNEINVVCSCCNYIICESVYCERVLPLPSSDLNIDDFFCHKHNHKEGDDKNSINNRLKTVSKGDLLYDDNYSFKINTDYFTRKQYGVLHCDKCFSWIGRKTENFVKLWNSSVLINNEKQDSIKPLHDFNNVILSMLNCIRPTIKIVITCSVSNESDHFILLNVLNKNLTVLTNCPPKSVDESNSEIVKLCEKNVVKVSYNYVEEKNEAVKMWLNDPYIDTVEVSKQMLLTGCNSLLKSTLLIAKPYRFIENMKIGFIGLV